MAERWFFALWPPPAAAGALAAGARGLVPRSARGAHPLDIHLTLKFLGPLTPEQLLAARHGADSLRCPPFVLRLDQAGSFPRARVLWCGPTLVPAGLRGLVDGLEQALAVRGFAPEHRPLRPHLTLARRFSGPTTLPWALPIEWEVCEFVLARGRDGLVPRYAPLCRWPLVAGP